MYERKADYEADLATVRDPATDESTLDALLSKHHGEMAIAEAVARHPACSFRTVVQFWRFARHLVELNPSLPELQKHQNWEQSARREPRKHNRWSSEVSLFEPEIYRLVWVMENGESAYQRRMMEVEAIPEAVIREHVGSKNAALRKSIARRKTAPEDIFEQLARDSAKTVRETLAANPEVPPAIIASLAADKDAAVAEAARNNPACPDDAVHRARLADAAKPAAATSIDQMGFHELAGLAGDENTPAETLAELAGHEQGCVRFLVGFNQKSPPAVLEKIAADSEPWVQAGAAFNPNTPIAALQALVDSDDTEVLTGLASNPSLDEATQLKLAEADSDLATYTLANLTQYPSVWAAFAKQAQPAKQRKYKTWRNFLDEALKDNFVGLTQGLKSQMLSVARVAARSEQCPPRLIGHYAYYLFDDYRQNPATALALLEGKTHVKPKVYKDWKIDMWLSERRAPGHVSNFYIRSDEEKRRMKAISSPTTQLVYVLPLLLTVGTVDRKRIAERSDLNRFAFEMLLRDEKSGVREMAAKNKKCPKGLLKIVKGDKATTVRSAAGKRTKSSSKAGSTVNQGSATERARLAKKTSSSKILEELVQDRAASVRLAVAENRETPENVLLMFADDKEAKVRRAVASRTGDKSALRKLVKDEAADVRLAAANNWHWRKRNPETKLMEYDQAFLTEIAESPDAAVREVSAANTDSETLHARFLKDVPEVTRKLATNRHLAMAKKLELARLTDDQDTLGALARKTDNEELFLIAAEKITSNHANDPIRCHQVMLSRPAVQDKLCQHPLMAVRRALSHQQQLTPKAKQALLNDPEDSIRRWVIK